MKESIVQHLWHSLFGYRYYLPVFVDKGGITTRTSATPFRTLKEAQEASTGLTAYIPIEIITFRSRHIYSDGIIQDLECDQNGNYHFL